MEQNFFVPDNFQTKPTVKVLNVVHICLSVKQLNGLFRYQQTQFSNQFQGS